MAVLLRRLNPSEHTHEKVCAKEGLPTCRTSPDFGRVNPYMRSENPISKNPYSVSSPGQFHWSGYICKNIMDPFSWWIACPTCGIIEPRQRASNNFCFEIFTQPPNMAIEWFSVWRVIITSLLKQTRYIPQGKEKRPRVCSGISDICYSIPIATDNANNANVANSQITTRSSQWSHIRLPTECMIFD